jgi:L-galactose dehydrogenase
MLNSSVARLVLPKAERKGVATLVMFAVRRVFADLELLREICGRLIESGEISAEMVDLGDPFGFLLREEGNDVRTLTEAAYRYCRHLAGTSVVLTGTSRREHLVENIESIEGPPLAGETLRMIDTLFGRVVSVTGEK